QSEKWPKHMGFFRQIMDPLIKRLLQSDNKIRLLYPKASLIFYNINCMKKRIMMCFKTSVNMELQRMRTHHLQKQLIYSRQQITLQQTWKPCLILYKTHTFLNSPLTKKKELLHKKFKCTMISLNDESSCIQY